MSVATARFLLPSNATPFEVALAAVDQRLDDLPAEIVVDVTRPDRCPEALLPYLAWQRRVLVWDPDWPLSFRRSVVAVAYEVARHGGTIWSMRTALAAIGIRIDVAEWWQQTPKGAPYTFRVICYSDRALRPGQARLPPDVMALATAVVRATKPKSRSVIVGAGERYDGVWHIGLGLLAETEVTIQPFKVPSQPTLGSVVVGGGVLIERLTTVETMQ